MNRDVLEQLLRDAAVDETPPALRSDLAERVRARARQQRHVRAIGGGVMVATCAIAALAWMIRPDAGTSLPSPLVVQATRPVPSSSSDARAELLALSREADRRAAAAEALWAVERRATRPPRAGISSDVASQVERAAFTMVYQAARMPASGGPGSPAADVYRQVTQAFPGTPSAQVARQRLNELANRKDG
jgi:hypothetical protein